MRRVGDVVRVAQGLAVARAPDGEHPSVGTEVVAADLSTVGEVVDVFGPVERPYVAVSPVESRSPASLLGTAVYAR